MSVSQTALVFQAPINIGAVLFLRAALSCPAFARRPALERLPQGRRPEPEGGLATYPHDAKTPHDIIRQADEMMYMVKNSTRDNIASSFPPLRLRSGQRSFAKNAKGWCTHFIADTKGRATRPFEGRAGKADGSYSTR